MSRFLRVLLFVILIVAILLSGLALVGGPRIARRSFPQVSGEVHLAGLDGPVDIFRDALGVPHIYASSEHDLFFSQGYVHAQDRFWQMDFWRHMGAARLSEMFGDGQLETDRFLRTLGWERIAREELAAIDADSLSLLEAYAEGVNAYLNEHQGTELSLEYGVLGLLTPSYSVAPWEPVHSMTWAKAMAWDLGGNMSSEIHRARLLKLFSPEKMAEIAPPYPQDHPVIVPALETASSGQDSPPSLQALQDPQLQAALQHLSAQLAAVEALLGSTGAEVGSNNWVISGERTATGKPILANDPHLAEQIPSIWYEVGLYCTPKGPDCPYQVTGFSFAGAPGVIIGHNERIAWGVTSLAPDVQDLYIEKINPQNPNQYEYNGQWVDMELVEETLHVGGGEDEVLLVRLTRHGPIISEVYAPLEDFAQESGGVDLPQNYAIALRWTALEPAYLLRAIWNFNRAQNWEEFRDGARDFAVPAQNLVFADVDGNIGYQMPGKVPMRTNGDGALPVPGWTDEYEWSGYIPFEDLPSSYNPPEGYVATANNAVVGPDYPHLITVDWDHGFRAARIVEMIEKAPGAIDIAYVQKMQGDNKDLSAAFLVPLLLQLVPEEEREAQALRLLETWDHQNDINSAPAALYGAFWKHLLASTFHDELTEDLRPNGSSRWFEVMRQLADQPDSSWWDDQSTPAVERRDDILARAFASALADVEDRLGKDPSGWKWGDLHTTTFHHQSLGKSGVAPIEAIFNRGPYPTGGGSSVVNNTGWHAARSYQVAALPSMRMIVDLADMNNSLAVHTTGQSGHAYHPNYTDMVDLWRRIEYHPMRWERSQVEASSPAHLKLVP